MRLWSLHPSYLDRKGLSGCWSESFLARSILIKLENPSAYKVIGFRNHSQLVRFKATCDPLGYVNTYLHHICQEACSRGYNYNATRLTEYFDHQLEVTTGQLYVESLHLLRKLRQRDPDYASKLENAMRQNNVRVHPMFTLIEGPVAPWEKEQADQILGDLDDFENIKNSTDCPNQ